MQKRRIDFEKFDKWLKEQAQTASRIVDKKVAEEHYFDAAEMSGEANTYEFISVLINEVPAELPDFVIVEEKNCEACKMTNQEAIKELRILHDVIQNIGFRPVIKKAIEALEKAIPQKPIKKIEVEPVIDENGAYVDGDIITHLYCPACDSWVGIADFDYSAFCPNCGQAIEDWSEEDDN